MECPYCCGEMEYEEIKWPAGFWHCECGKEYEGERFLCGENDYEETLGEEIKIGEEK